MDENSLKKILLQKKKQLESHLKDINEDDVLITQAVVDPEAIASATYSAERSSRILVMKNKIEEMIKKINHSLEKVKKGTYDICERCGNKINTERLLAIPMTIFCINCATST